MKTSLIMRAAAVVVAVAAAPAGAQVATPLSGQEAVVSLSLQEALEGFTRNSPELGLARSRLRAALGNARQGRAIPNPTASITNEDLGQSSERYFNLSQRVDFFWEGGSRGRRAEARESEARAAFQVDSARMALDVKRAFVDAWQQARVLSALSEVDGVVAEVLDDARIRFVVGRPGRVRSAQVTSGEGQCGTSAHACRCGTGRGRTQARIAGGG
jgi:outer membrane protein TolC